MDGGLSVQEVRQMVGRMVDSAADQVSTLSLSARSSTVSSASVPSSRRALPPIAPGTTPASGKKVSQRGRLTRRLHQRLATPRRQQRDFSTTHAISGAAATQNGSGVQASLLHAERKQREKQDEMAAYLKRHNMLTKFEVCVWVCVCRGRFVFKRLLVVLLKRFRLSNTHVSTRTFNTHTHSLTHDCSTHALALSLLSPSSLPSPSSPL